MAFTLAYYKYVEDVNMFIPSKNMLQSMAFTLPIPSIRYLIFPWLVKDWATKSTIAIAGNVYSSLCLLAMLALPDPAEIVEATSVDCQKNNLKALMFPTMDEPDALPSTYISRVMTALSKWSCKLHALLDAFSEMDSNQLNLKAILNLISSCLSDHSLPDISFLRREHASIYAQGSSMLAEDCQTGH